MYRTLLLAVLTSATVTGTAEAQLFRGRAAKGSGGVSSPHPVQRYTAGPEGTLYVMPAAHPEPVVSGVVSHGPAAVDPCCPCPPGSGPCKDHCDGPRIVLKPHNCPPHETCKPIDVIITPGPNPDCVEIPFYGRPVAFKHNVKVPVRVIECEEIIRFKDYTIDLKCCQITVCVPCERCIVKREKCVEQMREVAIEAYRRRDGTIDVYALNVPGLPNKFVLKLKMSESDFKTAYPSVTPPTYP